MKLCGESRIMDYCADTVCFVVSWGACEGFSSGACLSDCQIFLMWHVQVIQSLALLKDRHPCLVLKPVYLLIRVLVVVTWGLSCSQRIIFNIVVLLLSLLPITFVLLRTCFTSLWGWSTAFMDAASSASFKRLKDPLLWLTEIPACSTKLKHTLISVQSLVTSGLWGHFSSASCCIWLSLLIWSRKNYSEIVLPLQFVLGRLLVLAVDSQPCADQ